MAEQTSTRASQAATGGGGASWARWHDSSGPGTGAGDGGDVRHHHPLMDALAARLIRGPAGNGPLRRQQDGRMAGGVAAGIAARTGLDVSAVRLALVVLALISTGYGLAVYLLAWLIMPAAGEPASIGHKALTDKRGIGQATALASLLIIGMIIASALNAPWITTFAGPLIICPSVLVLIWRNAPEDEQAVLRRLASPFTGLSDGVRTSRPIVRLLIAAVLIGVGLAGLLHKHERWALLIPLAGILLVIAGIAVVLGPWWLRIARDLVAERQARVRAEERAEMASRVHDSVLQTLALIQRRAADPQQVMQLARAQERELRAWLFDGRAPGSLDGQAATIADGVRLIQQDVEAQHGMPVDAVTVGDCELDDELSALLAAAREATVNAAKWSGAESVSLFAEVEPDSVSVFVRDRGRGFDPDGVSADRKGLAESVHARMARRGGTATVRSAPGEGTEVSLTMPRLAADRQQRRP
jgi:signal transduction histidine kinase/phage shock protein PspC (stress-responsive transcriptional regulator)